MVQKLKLRTRELTFETVFFVELDIKDGYPIPMGFVEAIPPEVEVHKKLVGAKQIYAVWV